MREGMRSSDRLEGEKKRGRKEGGEEEEVEDTDFHNTCRLILIQ